MLEHLNQKYRIAVKGLPCSREKLQNLSQFNAIDEQLRQYFEEAGESEFEGPEGRYFRLLAPTGCFQSEQLHSAFKHLDGALPIGDDGGGNMIAMRGSKIYSVGFGVMDFNAMILLANSLKEFLEEPEKLWPWTGTTKNMSE